MYTHVCQYTMYLCVYYPREDYVYFDNLQPPTNHNDASYDMRNRSNCFMISQQHRSCKGEVRWSQGANWCSNMTRITDAVVFKTQGSDVMVFMIIMTLTRFFRACSMKAVECIPLGEWITIMCKGAVFQKEDQTEMLLISQKAWKTKGEEESEGWSQMRGSRMPRRNFPPDASGHAENMAILATQNSFEAIARQRNITTKNLKKGKKYILNESLTEGVYQDAIFGDSSHSQDGLLAANHCFLTVPPWTFLMVACQRQGVCFLVANFRGFVFLTILMSSPSVMWYVAPHHIPLFHP